MPITYDDIAKHAWTQIRAINNAGRAGSCDLASFVGYDAARIIRHQFHSTALPDLAGLKFIAQNPVPSPQLDQMAKEFGFKGLSATTDLLKSVKADLGEPAAEVLKTFDAGGFLGIAYDRMVWVQDKDMIDTVLHEMVHTLQWKKFSQEPFLSRYIKGFSDALIGFIHTHRTPPVGMQKSVVYMSNPPETNAYGFQQQFLAQINKALSANPAYSLTHSPTMATMKNTGGGNRSQSDVADRIIAEPSLNITLAKAIVGM